MRSLSSTLVSKTLLGLSATALLLTGCGKKKDPVQPGDEEYALEVRYLGTPPAAATQQAFVRAVNRIKSIVVGGLSPVLIEANFNVEECDASLAGFDDVPAQTVEGLIIYVLVEAIDGQGSVLGSAGPCLVRDQNDFKPALGIMRLDEADLAAFTTQERLDALILHEMLHVVGFGTIWTDNNLLSGVDTPDARFLGEAARVACRNENGGLNTCASTVPVHSGDGVGSAYAHWREAVFTNELMTPFLNAGAAPMSAMTIRSLADLGYEVSTTSADAYAVSAGLMALRDAEDAAPAIALPAPTTPRYRIRANGTLVPFAR